MVEMIGHSDAKGVVIPGETEAPVRVKLSRAKGWRMPPNTVKVDRSTRWGNPFAIESMGSTKLWCPDTRSWLTGLCSVRLIGGRYWYRSHLSRRQAVMLSCEMFAAEVGPALDPSPLRGKNLACWCALDAPCHADVLLELANASATTANAVGTEPKAKCTKTRSPYNG